MAYEIFLIDSLNSIQLDTDDIDLTTTFSVADVKDLAARKDSITKQVTFKGTKINNEAFGYMFHLNKVTDTSLSNKIFFNYNPLRTVDCFVYEFGMLLLKGNLRVLEVNVAKGLINYATVITGSFIEFKGKIVDKLLTDLDFEDLKHRYSAEVVKNSWDTSIELYNPATTTFSTTAFQKGKGYVYPYIDYAQQFLISDSNASNADVTKFHGLNFRPSVYVKEYFNKIFSQPDLPGWTYEIIGDDEFQDKFNSLIVPYSAEKLQYSFNGFNQTFEKSLIIVDNQVGGSVNGYEKAKLISMVQSATPPANTISPYVIGQTNSILSINRPFKSDAQVTVNFASINNTSPIYRTLFKVQLVERPASASTEQLSGWTMVAEKVFLLEPSQVFTNKNILLSIGERQFNDNMNLAVRVYMFGRYSDVTYTIDAAILSVPKDTGTTFTADIRYANDTDYDVIAPRPPENIKQMDFLKSIMSLFNLYAYTLKTNPKHLIFSKYDDYYAMSGHGIIKSNAIEWTKKIDYNDIKLKSNLTLAKSYQFTYKEDTDWLNAEYKRKHGLLFGTYEYTDAFGVVDTKKVEIIFSPTPILEPAGTKRYFPALYILDSGNKKPLKTNIRILYYNGIKTCNEYSILKDEFTTLWTTAELFPPLTTYPQASTYYYDSAGNPVEDLSFGRSKEYYFPIDANYLNVSQAYSSYYSNQVTELTNVNIFTIEADVLLNEIDISNLDLRTPVFIDLGELGHSYFKVLSVEYISNSTTSKVILQKIYLGTNS